ncbi:putative glutamine synthetase [Streptomyces sp. Tu6071]|nr:putative glutamine synthetase [Streptomyces sp. Tu6071]
MVLTGRPERFEVDTTRHEVPEAVHASIEADDLRGRERVSAEAGAKSRQRKGRSPRHGERPRARAPRRARPAAGPVTRPERPSRASDLPGLLQRGAARLRDEPRHHVRVHVRVRAAVLDVPLAVLLDLPRNPHRGAPVGDPVAVLVPRGRLVEPGEAVVDARAVVLHVVERLGALAERFAGGDDRLVALAHRLRREVGVRARAVPVALHRLRVERRRDAEVLGSAVEQPARDPQLVRDVQRRERADLELPLPRHDLGVDAGDAEPGGEAVGEVGLDDLAAEDLVRTDAAVVTALRGGETVLGEAERAAALEEGVLLLDPEDRLLGGELLGHGPQFGARVARVRGEVGVEDLAQDEDVGAAPDRVGTREDRLEHAVRGVALGLVRGGAVEAPHARLRAVRDDLRLRPELGGRLGAVDPDVLGLEAHSGYFLHSTTRPRGAGGGCGDARRMARGGCPAVAPV